MDHYGFMITTDLAVLTTLLPFVDRGTLSRAWYDALHLARPNNPVAASGPVLRRSAHDESAKSPVLLHSGRSAVAVSHPVRLPVIGKRATLTPVIHAKPPRPDRLIARCRSLGENCAPKIPTRTAAIVQLPEGRICLVMQGNKDGLRVTALCPPALRERVAQALAHVQALLYTNGISCDMRIGAPKA